MTVRGTVYLSLKSL